jgi:ParB-like chromosome segregation protein Spo0J
MTQSELAKTPPRRRLTVTVTLLLSTLLLAGLALHLTASSFERRSAGHGSLAERTAWARLAARLEPWSATFAHRARVMQLWEEGQQHLAAGDYNGAVEVLRQAYRADVGNAELLDLFLRAQATQTLATNRKAHLQHAHEGPGGTLRPQDVER